jgi:hypothetical protein
MCALKALFVLWMSCLARCVGLGLVSAIMPWLPLQTCMQPKMCHTVGKAFVRRTRSVLRYRSTYPSTNCGLQHVYSYNTVSSRTSSYHRQKDRNDYCFDYLVGSSRRALSRLPTTAYTLSDSRHCTRTAVQADRQLQLPALQHLDCP